MPLCTSSAVRRGFPIFLAISVGWSGLAAPASAQDEAPGLLIPTASPSRPAGSLDSGFELNNVQGAQVLSISPQDDGDIVFGGTFSQIDNVARGELARVHSNGTLDASFSPAVIESYNTRTDATVTQTDSHYVPAVFATAIQPDGKILVGGSFYFINGVSGYGGLVRLNADGSLDSSFKAPRFSGTVFAIALRDNGKILVGGDFSYVDSKHRNALVQLTATGKYDNSFQPGSFAGTVPSADAVSAFPTVHAIQLQSDGKVIVGGIFTSIGDTPRRAIARLGTDGTVDASFVPDASFNPPAPSQSSDASVDQVLTLAVQADGKVVVGGNFRDPATTSPINSIYRLNGNGSVDTAFNPGGVGTLKNDPLFPGANPVVNAVVLQPDGKILLGGIFVAYNGMTANLIARLNTDGTLDESFDIGEGPSQSVLTLALQPDGSLLAGGSFPTVDSVARRLIARFTTTDGVPQAVVVSVVASTRRAFEAGRIKGIFTVTRAGGNLDAPLQVNYTVGGGATPGVDYKALTGAVTILGGNSSANIRVKPFDDAILEGTEKVKIFLTESAAYGLSPKARATVIIVDDQMAK